MDLVTIFIPIGVAIMGISIIAMVIIYGRLLYEKREYTNGNKYEDEYGLELERLMSTIPQYGLLLLTGFIITTVSFVMGL